MYIWYTNYPVNEIQISIYKQNNIPVQGWNVDNFYTHLEISRTQHHLLNNLIKIYSPCLQNVVIKSILQPGRDWRHRPSLAKSIVQILVCTFIITLSCNLSL